jgi:hypothetical protein
MIEASGKMITTSSSSSNEGIDGESRGRNESCYKKTSGISDKDT